MTLILPFVYYSGLTGWNLYLYFFRRSTAVVLDGNFHEHDLVFSVGDNMRLRYSRGSGISEMEIRFLNVRVDYLYPQGFYAVMGGIYTGGLEAFLGFSSEWKPSVYISFDRRWKRGRFEIRVRGVGKYYGGYSIPLGRVDSWGYRRLEVRGPVAYSISLLGYYTLRESVVYAGFMPVGKRGMDLIVGGQYFNGRLSVGGGLRFFYPVIGNLSLFIGVNPASRRWDVFVGAGRL